MIKLFSYLLILLIFGCAILFSCKKELSCEECIGNKPPFAKAGRDTILILPIDSLMLDGTASYDPDGSISMYSWSKISGPLPLSMSAPQAAKTVIKNLVHGVYRFELKVTDDGGLSARDTVVITIDSVAGLNHPPVAIAGPDRIITLPIDSVMLDGSQSFDPDNNIASYLWNKISGPSSFIISNTNATQTLVKSLVEGVYLFELKVTDAGGLTGIDTMKVTINPATTTINCNNRPVINATLVPIGSLSVARYGVVSATAGSKILFAGGWIPGAHSTRVDIYDTNTHIWSTAELTVPERDGMVIASVGSKILFAGGGNNDWIDVTSRVDIYDAASNTWSTDELSQARNYLSAVTVGNKVYFGGGGYWGPITPGSPQLFHIGSTVVDIYDNSTNTWSTASLSEGRYELSATVAGNKIYFAGGLKNMFDGSNRIDIYDIPTNSWSTSQLQEVKASHGSINIGNKIFWAAGAKNSYQSGYQLSDKIEIKDISTGVSTFDCIGPKAMFSVVPQNNNVVFFTGFNNGSASRFEIYNTATNSWSIGELPISIQGAAIISVNNTIYVAGGAVNGVYSDQVWKLEF